MSVGSSLTVMCQALEPLFSLSVSGCGNLFSCCSESGCGNLLSSTCQAMASVFATIYQVVGSSCFVHFYASGGWKSGCWFLPQFSFPPALCPLWALSHQALAYFSPCMPASPKL